MVRATLDQVIRMLEPYDHRIIIAVDESSGEYLSELVKFCSPDIVVTNPQRRYLRGELLNKAFDLTDPNHLKLFIEEDFYWRTPCLDIAFPLLLKVDHVMLHRYPISERQFEDVTEEYGFFKPDCFWKWNMHPGLGLDPYPAGRFPAMDKGIEAVYASMFNKRGKKSAALMKDHFTHIGVIDGNLHFRAVHARHLGIPDTDDRELILKAFEGMACRKEHVEYFKEYLGL